MRPRKFDRDNAENLIKCFHITKMTEGKKLRDTGYLNNQFVIAELMIERALACWNETSSSHTLMANDLRLSIEKRFGVGWPYCGLICISPRGMKEAAEYWDLTETQVQELGLIIMGLTPEALVQQVKRWKTRLIKGSSD